MQASTRGRRAAEDDSSRPELSQGDVGPSSPRRVLRVAPPPRGRVMPLPTGRSETA